MNRHPLHFVSIVVGIFAVTFFSTHAFAKGAIEKPAMATAVNFEALLDMEFSLAANDRATNQAYEDFSGSHGSTRTEKTGFAGKLGVKGERGEVGSKPGVVDPFHIKGDVSDGCSKYLRCSAE